MLSSGGNITKIIPAIIIILLFPVHKADCQNSILDSTFTFREGIVETTTALAIISKHTGYRFTYDSRLINGEKKTDMTFLDTTLGVILSSILMNDSISFSVIDKYIIISREQKSVSFTADSSATDKVNYITGIILDDETRDPLPYATVALKNKGLGTVSNNNGNFGLKITSDQLFDTLSVSYLGYFGREFAVNQSIGNELSITMKREFISIPEIIIRTQIPQEVISRARISIPDNFGSTPALLTGFYREGVLRKRELQSYSEAILQIFKSAYSGSLLNDQIKVIKSRKIENSNRTDTLAIRLKAGLSTCLELDGARNIYDFLDQNSIPDYIYRITDIVTYDGESAYVVDFEQRQNIETALFKGAIYINTIDFGILHAEFELNPSLINTVKNSYISNSAPGFNTWPESIKYSISYRKIDNRYFLNHVRGDLLFTSNQKKKLFNAQFRVFFELAVTEINLENVARFGRDEIAPIHSIFSKIIYDYDQKFWENQNFLRPEDNLLQALKNMNVKLQEFSK
jgi:hypothetical protein